MKDPLRPLLAFQRRSATPIFSSAIGRFGSEMSPPLVSGFSFSLPIGLVEPSLSLESDIAEAIPHRPAGCFCLGAKRLPVPQNTNPRFFFFFFGFGFVEVRHFVWALPYGRPQLLRHRGARFAFSRNVRRDPPPSQFLGLRIRASF